MYLNWFTWLQIFFDSVDEERWFRGTNSFVNNWWNIYSCMSWNIMYIRISTVIATYKCVLSYITNKLDFINKHLWLYYWKRATTSFQFFHFMVVQLNLCFTYSFEIWYEDSTVTVLIWEKILLWQPVLKHSYASSNWKTGCMYKSLLHNSGHNSIHQTTMNTQKCLCWWYIVPYPCITIGWS